MSNLPINPVGASDELLSLESKFQKEILDSGSGPNRTLPEEIFVNTFLPFFCGEEKVDSNNNTIAKWISIAGTPMSEVTITDNAGQPIFTVPSLFDTSIIDVVKKDMRMGLKEIVANKEVHSRNIAAAGEKYVVEALDKKASAIIQPSTQVSTNAERWNQIFTRYGKGNISVEADGSAEKDKDSNINDFFI